MLLLVQNNYDCDGFSTWIPWLFGAFILGVILGWLLSKIFNSNDDCDKLQSRYDSLQAELDACRSNSKKITSSLAGASSFTTAKKEVTPIADDSVKDDLTKVEGIGPKIQGLLNNDGIWSWKQLSESSEKRLQKILDDAGPAYTIHKPKTWAKQALLCHNGEWDKLKKWQSELKGGV